MDVRIMHGSTNISSHVIAYRREHKICTGVGMIELEIDYTYGGTFDPWDLIDLYENGSHTAKYYVSTASEGQPSASFTVSAQDNSKRLNDYFITDSYFIDYPSYSRYWIELFLSEAGVSYTFMTNSPGNLLSNNTSLGMTSAYEQILMLLQMNGWYITFNPSGRAIIGKLDIDTAKSAGKINNSDIISIQSNKNDRMYRNRVVVWGSGDPENSRWVFADVRKPTKWDYGKKDLRTILISNSNIPTVKDAFMLANQALTEFCKLNTEKYITLENARSYSVGNVIGIKSKVFSGKALITTMATSMSKNGLITELGCDERCPRLFGFFNPGGYVYVGTFGSGIWRKHILDYGLNGTPSGVVLSGFASGIYTGEWFDYSSGLMDMNITDLHVNAGVLSSISSSGQLYYNLEDEGPWSGVMLSGLDVSYSGTVVDPTIYSGVMGRATIIDRDTNFIRYAVDTQSGINYGDFLYETDPLRSGAGNVFWYTDPSGNLIGSGAMLSGFAPSGRAWILDVNPYDGTVSGVYPIFLASGITVMSGITLSGNYNFSVYDIENDGSNDYVEAKTYGSGLMPVDIAAGYFYSDTLHNFGELDNGINHYITFGANEKSSIYNMLPYSGYPTPILQTVVNYGSISHVDGLDGGYALYADTTDLGFIQYSFNRLGKRRVGVYELDYNAAPISNPHFISTTYNYTATSPLASARPYPNIFRFYFREGPAAQTLSGKDLLTVDLDIDTNLITETLTSNVLEERDDAFPSFTPLDANMPAMATLVRGNILYSLKSKVNPTGASSFDIYLYMTDLDTLSTVSRKLYTREQIGSGASDGNKLYYPSIPMMSVYGENDVQLCVTYGEYTYVGTTQLYVRYHRFTQKGFYGSGSSEELIDFSGEYGLTGFSIRPFSIGNHLTRALNYNHTLFSYSIPANAYSPSITFSDFVDSVQRNASIISGRYFGNSMDTYIGSNGGNFYLYNSNNGSVKSAIPHPSGYTLLSYAGRDSFNDELMFYATNIALATKELICINEYSQVTRRQPSDNSEVGMVAIGNFRVNQRVGVNGDSFIHWTRPMISGYYPIYMLLQRDGYDYNVVKSGYYQERVDISNFSPIVTMGRRVDSIETYFISQDGEVLETSNTAMSGFNIGSGGANGRMFTMNVLGEDMRYYDSDGYAGSGTAESGLFRNILIAYSGSMGQLDAYTLSAFSGYVLNPSGYINRIETSNYCLPDQYVFYSVSGYTASGLSSSGWGFFQKSPSYSGYDTSSGVFVDYSSGYPQARTTIIRLDDSI